MTSTEFVAIHIALAVLVVIATAYFAGRVHEWYRHGFEREVAYREGYDQASRALFNLAVRKVPAKPDLSAPVRTGPVRTGPLSAGPVRTGPLSTGPVRPALTRRFESTADRLRHTEASQH